MNAFLKHINRNCYLVSNNLDLLQKITRHCRKTLLISTDKKHGGTPDLLTATIDQNACAKEMDASTRRDSLRRGHVDVKTLGS